MRGPIDFIIVGFEGNQFKGEILKELSAATENKTIAVLDLAVIAKDADGNIEKIEAVNLDDKIIKDVMGATKTDGLIDPEDVAEVGELLEPNCAAGLLIIEHLWAKGLKKAIADAGGVLLADGRIHPDASAELNEGGK